VNRIHDLAHFARVIVKLLNWLDDNFDRLFVTLREQCPDVTDRWIGDKIMMLTFSNAFGGADT